jgi:hypothetical protein
MHELDCLMLTCTSWRIVEYKLPLSVMLLFLLMNAARFQKHTKSGQQVLHVFSKARVAFPCSRK